MNFRKIFSVLFICFASLVLLSKINITFTSQPKFIFAKDSNYDKEWKRVDSLADKGLTQSALSLTQQIYEHAVKENNSPQLIKAILYRMRFEETKEEFSLEKSIHQLSKEVELAKFPAKPLLQSILADAYWQYYQNNRWKFLNRTGTVNFVNEDVSTWDLNRILDACIKNHLASLENEDGLKQTKIDYYDYILTKGSSETRVLRPSLYDFVAHRALDFFKSTEADLNRPGNQFNLNDEIYLKPSADLIRYQIKKPEDSLNLKYYALITLQQLTKFHINDKTPEALIDVELERLKYVYSESANELKDSLYIQSLQNIANQFKTNSSSAEVLFELASYYNNIGLMYKPMQNEELKWYRKKALSIFEDVIKRFPTSYGASHCKSLLEDIKFRSLDFTVEHVNEPNKPFRAFVSYRNFNKIYFRIIKTSYEKDRAITSGNWGEERIKKYLELKADKSFEYTLPDDADYNQHSVEVKIPELAFGYYIILASTSPDFNFRKHIVAHASCWTSNLAYTSRRMFDGSYDIYVMNRQSGERLKGVKTQLWYDTYNSSSRNYVRKKGDAYTTDENGFVNIPQMHLDNTNDFYLEFTKDQDYLHSENTFYSFRANDNKKMREQTFIFTDRAIYRPGQTIYFKAIHLSSDGKENQLLTKKPITLALYDVNNQKVSEQQLTTNDYGTVAGSFTAPVGSLNGQMRISDNFGNAYFSVEEYKRPKFETKFNPVKGSFALGDEIKIEAKATAYSGNSIDGAQVKYRVLRNINYPYWWNWYRAYYPRQSAVEITNGTTISNDTGGYSITFKALPDLSVSKKDEPTYVYTVYADVTDINGETHSTQTNVCVGYKMLKLNLDIEDKLNRDSIQPLKISCTNLNGVDEAAQGKISVYKLKQASQVFRDRLWEQPDKHIMSKEEYYRLFPNDLYEDETNKYKWERSDKLMEAAFDTEKKKEIDLTSSLKKLPAGTYLIESVCKDKNGAEVKSINYVTLYSTADKNEVPEQISDWYQSINSSGEPGQKASFIQASALKGTSYLLEVEHDKEIVFKTIKACDMSVVEIPIEEKYRGNFAYHITFIKNNRFYSHTEIVEVPYTNKELDITFETFRNKLLPGQQEEWKMIIKNKKGEKETAELLATMYDASLDAFKTNTWYFDVYSKYYSSLRWESNVGMGNNSIDYSESLRINYNPKWRKYDELNYFGLDFGNSNNVVDYEMANVSSPRGGGGKRKFRSVACPAFIEDGNNKKSDEKANYQAANSFKKGTYDEVDVKEKPTTKQETTDISNVKVRTNFNETAFFFPQLQTNEKGEIIIKFTVPESLTKWKMMGLAHTKDLKFGQVSNELVTQKDLMVQTNAPRFFRENDKMIFAAKVSNLTANELSGTAELVLFDALSNKPLNIEFSNKTPQINFTAAKGQSAALSWDISIPEGIQAVTYKVIAKAGNFSDGEEMALPVLSNKILVTESMPLNIRGKQSKEIDFSRFISQNNKSTTLRNHSYTLEFTSNPAWYAIQSLPYLMEYPYECAEQTFSRFYANSIATHIVNSAPKIKQVFDTWKMKDPDAFLSNLQKNQELKNLLLEETPWVMEAKNESERKNRVALLFDMNKMSNELESALSKLQKMQVANGGWPWFKGGPDDWYITQHIVSGMGHLDKLGVKNVREDMKTWQMLIKAINYCDDRLTESFETIKRTDKNYEKNNHLNNIAVQYLYARSYFKEIEPSAQNKKAIAYFTTQAKQYWLSNTRYMQGMIALGLNRSGDKKTPIDILKSMKENALYSEEMGMYWKENYSGLSWYEAPIESQALLIEAFDEIANDQKSVDDLKTWLIKSKQTQNWPSTKATCEAVYALLLRGTDWLATEPNVDIKIGNIKIDPKNDPSLKAEAGTGYIKKTWTGIEVNTGMGKVKLSKKDEGVSWGSLYWQYFEQLDKITPAQTPLQLNKKLFLQKNTASGPVIEPISANTILKPGDKITVRIELRVDRDMQYVHMKDMRAACFEPATVFSAYKWQDGLGYYQSTKDAATNFFFSYLHKGTFVFEYPLIVNQSGDFSNGITTIQCMYAPEFTSHSEGVRVEVRR